MNDMQYVIGAYAIAWLGVVYFIFTTMKKQRVLERRITDLEKLE